jgi:Thioredoxin-like proteins and domains
MSVAILTQFTPNPSALKFIINEDVKKTGKITFRSAEESSKVPLVSKLFDLGFVDQVHLFENVVTVTKSSDREWEEITETVKSVLVDNVPQHDSEIEDVSVTSTNHTIRSRDESPEIQKIEEVLDKTIRPYLQSDGGDLDVISYENDKVVVSYEGACGTCPSSVAGTLQAITNVLREEINSDIEVVTVNG